MNRRENSGGEDSGENVKVKEIDLFSLRCKRFLKFVLKFLQN